MPFREQADQPVMHRRDAVSSTQDEAARLIRDGARLPLAVATLDQRGGRGRLGRAWVSPRGHGLALTLAVRTDLPPHARGWIPLAAGIGALEALEAVAPGLRAATGLGLKWPNDLLVPAGALQAGRDRADAGTARDRKLGGILVEGRGTDTVMVGIGTNLRGPVRDGQGRELPGTAWLLGDDGLLAWAGVPVDAAERPSGEAFAWRLAEALAAAIAGRLADLGSADGDADAVRMHALYSMNCVTLGRDVRIQPLGASANGAAGAQELHGRAVGIDPDGRLVVQEAGGGTTAVGVGDVLHAGLAAPQAGSSSSRA